MKFQTARKFLLIHPTTAHLTYEGSVLNNFKLTHYDIIDNFNASESYKKKKNRFLDAFKT
jgi:hypothetical protein